MAAVQGAAQFTAVVAAPVQQVVDVDDAVAGLEFYRLAVGQGHAGVFEQLFVFGLGVEAAVAAGHHPEHLVVVERDIPLQIFGAVFQKVGLQGAHGRHVDGVDIAVPIGRAVVALRAAHHYHAGRAGVFRNAQ